MARRGRVMAAVQAVAVEGVLAAVGVVVARGADLQRDLVPHLGRKIKLKHYIYTV